MANNESLLIQTGEASRDTDFERNDSRAAFSLNGSHIDIDKMILFEERLKKDENIKKLMQMSPSIPNGFNMNCTQMDEKDFSTIIC